MQEIDIKVLKICQYFRWEISKNIKENAEKDKLQDICKMLENWKMSKRKMSSRKNIEENL